MLLPFLLSILVFSVCMRDSRQDNPTAIVPAYAGPDPGYILAESDGGLANRLRVLAAYMHIGEAKFDGAHLVFIWDVNSACPGHFLEVFRPIPHVVFATNASRYVLDKGAKIVYENSLAVMTWTLQMNNIPKNRAGFPSWHDIEMKMYAKYLPTVQIMAKVNDFVSLHNMCNASAMHLRLTDLSQHIAKKKKSVNMQSYFEFVESRPADEPVYLLTDNPSTQKLFIDKYGPKKILFYETIASTDKQVAFASKLAAGGLATVHGNTNISSDATNNSSSSSSNYNSANASQPAQLLPDDHRYTTLEHTLIDILIAAHAKTFKAAAFSSMSDLINTFKHLGRRERGWCASSVQHVNLHKVQHLN